MHINFFLGAVLTFLAFYLGAPFIMENVTLYMDLHSFILVTLATLAATLFSTTFSEIKAILNVFKFMVLSGKTLTAEDAVDTLVRISEAAQSRSKADLIEMGKADLFLTRALRLVASGLDRDFIEKSLETDIDEMRRRHDLIINKIRMMGAYAPTFGMAGTVIGVTQVLQNVQDVSTIVNGMSLALLTTLYGIILSSIVFTPFANRLKKLSEDEALVRQVVLDGILMIIDKEIPLKVEKYLSGYLNTSSKSENKDA